MTWIEIVTQVVIPGISTLAAIVGGGIGVFFWRENKALKQAEADKSKAEAQKSTTDARLAEADLAEKILEKFERSVLDRMDQGEAVRREEFSTLSKKIDKRFDVIEKEDRKQNEIIRDVVEFLNGDFQKFKKNKRKAEKAVGKKS